MLKASFLGNPPNYELLLFQRSVVRSSSLHACAKYLRNLCMILI